MFAFCFLTFSCGWFEEEEIREMQLSHGYKIFYDTENIAFNYIEILTEDGGQLLSECEEFYISDKNVYAKSFINDTDYEYYTIDHLNKKVSVISSKQYLEAKGNNKLIRYNDLK